MANEGNGKLGQTLGGRARALPEAKRAFVEKMAKEVTKILPPMGVSAGWVYNKVVNDLHVTRKARGTALPAEVGDGRLVALWVVVEIMGKRKRDRTEGLSDALSVAYTKDDKVFESFVVEVVKQEDLAQARNALLKVFNSKTEVVDRILRNALLTVFNSDTKLVDQVLSRLSYVPGREAAFAVPIGDVLSEHGAGEEPDSEIPYEELDLRSGGGPGTIEEMHEYIRRSLVENNVKDLKTRYDAVLLLFRAHPELAPDPHYETLRFFAKHVKEAHEGWTKEKADKQVIMEAGPLEGWLEHVLEYAGKCLLPGEAAEIKLILTKMMEGETVTLVDYDKMEGSKILPPAPVSPTRIFGETQEEEAGLLELSTGASAGEELDEGTAHALGKAWDESVSAARRKKEEEAEAKRAPSIEEQYLEKAGQVGAADALQALCATQSIEDKLVRLALERGEDAGVMEYYFAKEKGDGKKALEKLIKRGGEPEAGLRKLVEKSKTDEEALKTAVKVFGSVLLTYELARKRGVLRRKLDAKHMDAMLDEGFASRGAKETLEEVKDIYPNPLDRISLGCSRGCEKETFAHILAETRNEDIGKAVLLFDQAGYGVNGFGQAVERGAAVESVYASTKSAYSFAHPELGSLADWPLRSFALACSAVGAEEAYLAAAKNNDEAEAYRFLVKKIVEGKIAKEAKNGVTLPAEEKEKLQAAVAARVLEIAGMAEKETGRSAFTTAFRAGFGADAFQGMARKAGFEPAYEIARSSLPANGLPNYTALHLAFDAGYGTEVYRRKAAECSHIEAYNQLAEKVGEAGTFLAAKEAGAGFIALKEWQKKEGEQEIFDQLALLNESPEKAWETLSAYWGPEVLASASLNYPQTAMRQLEKKFSKEEVAALVISAWGWETALGLPGMDKAELIRSAVKVEGVANAYKKAWELGEGVLAYQIIAQLKPEEIRAMFAGKKEVAGYLKMLVENPEVLACAIAHRVLKDERKAKGLRTEVDVEYALFALRAEAGYLPAAYKRLSRHKGIGVKKATAHLLKHILAREKNATEAYVETISIADEAGCGVAGFKAIADATNTEEASLVALNTFGVSKGFALAERAGYGLNVYMVIAQRKNHTIQAFPLMVEAIRQRYEEAGVPAAEADFEAKKKALYYANLNFDAELALGEIAKTDGWENALKVGIGALGSATRVIEFLLPEDELKEKITARAEELLPAAEKVGCASILLRKLANKKHLGSVETAAGLAHKILGVEKGSICTVAAFYNHQYIHYLARSNERGALAQILQDREIRQQLLALLAEEEKKRKAKEEKVVAAIDWESSAWEAPEFYL